MTERRREQRLGAGSEQDEAGKKAVGKGEGAGQPLPVTSVAGAGDEPVATVNPGGERGGWLHPKARGPTGRWRPRDPNPRRLRALPGAPRDGGDGDAPRLGPGRVR